MKPFVVSLLLFISFPGIAQRYEFHIRRDKPLGPMKPFWTYFGYDEPNYTYRSNGKKLLTELKLLSPAPVYIRTHNLLTSKGNSKGPDLKWGYTNVYTEDKMGKPMYSWTVVDSIIDTYVTLGMKPLMEIGFMPKDLSTKPEPYDHTWSTGGNIWTGWTYPPKDYDKWRELVFQWVAHSLKRYGNQEVESWLWEVWNEPDIPYWSGTHEEYCKMYDYAADGLKRACPACKIGGPHTTSPRSEKAYQYLTRFIDHCLYETNYATGKTGTPLEYIGFHAKGAPEYIDGHIRMNMGAQLKDIARGFEAISSYPALKNIPIIIGECDPEGCAACSAKRDPKYGYRNGTMYSSYTAASFARIYELMDRYQVNLQGAVSWSFEFEDQDWFAGFRDLATHGVDKPVLNVFRMLGIMHGQRLEINTNEDHFSAEDIIKNGVRSRPDVFAVASTTDSSTQVMLWNYHDYEMHNLPASIKLVVEGIEARKVKYHHYRIDQKHSNSYEQWKKMGSPQAVDKDQYIRLESSGHLKELHHSKGTKLKNGLVELEFELPAQGVSLIKIDW